MDQILQESPVSITRGAARNLRIVAPGALAIGFAGDMLLRTTPWGLNVGLWTLVLVTAIWATARAARTTVSRGAWYFLGGAVLFAFAYALRDSAILCVMNLLGIMVCLAMAAYCRQGRSPLVGAVGEYLLALPAFWTMSAIGIFHFLRGEDREGIESGAPAPQAQGAQSSGWIYLRGILLALPFLLVFGSLLLSADAVFSSLWSSFLNYLQANIVAHVAWTAVFASLGAGLIRELLLSSKRIDAGGAPRSVLSTREVCIALGLIDLLFLLFVIVQFRYLFGGSALVHQIAHMTYTEYARGGFFELVWVTGLALPTMLFMHWLISAERAGEMRIFALVCGIMIAELFVIIASAVFRMATYVDAYGLTELRLYTTVFMFWLGGVFTWLAITVLTGRRQSFTFGAIASALMVAIALDLTNPDAIIVRVNAQRATASVPFDAGYATSLGADPAPALIEVLPRLDPAVRAQASIGLMAAWQQMPGDWRNWNCSRAAAHVTVERHLRELKIMAGGHS